MSGMKCIIKINLESLYNLNISFVRAKYNLILSNLAFKMIGILLDVL